MTLSKAGVSMDIAGVPNRHIIVGIDVLRDAGGAMGSKLTGQSAVSRAPEVNSVKSIEISPQALQAWSRIPSVAKVEILAAVERPSSVRDGTVKTVKVGNQMLMVKKMTSGFRVLYEQGLDRNIIVSVLTPREAGLLAG